MHDCNITGNGLYAFSVSSCSDPTTVIDATNNWWGVTDSAAIEAIVYHQDDAPDLPTVDFVPFADSAFAFGDTTPCCNHDGLRGDVDYDMSLNVGDLTYLVAYLFQGGPASPCSEEADADGDGGINVGDLTYLVAYLFQGGPAPPACP